MENMLFQPLDEILRDIEEDRKQLRFVFDPDDPEGEADMVILDEDILEWVNTAAGIDSYGW